MHRGFLVVLTTVGFLGGCSKSREEYRYNPNDRVDVRAPFVNVRVGEDGGAKVRAPFTRVETPRYKAHYETTNPAAVSPPIQPGAGGSIPPASGVIYYPPVNPNPQAISMHPSSGVGGQPVNANREANPVR